jgi:hypothetical protein
LTVNKIFDQKLFLWGNDSDSFETLVLRKTYYVLEFNVLVIVLFVKKNMF